MNIDKRHLDQLKLIEKLDISPSMYRNAVEKYQNLANYLQSKGIKADIYPQGSFAIGTVIRPYDKDNEKNYDLDFICQIEGDKSQVGPKELRDSIEKVLLDSQYRDKLTIYDECFQITYADKNEVGFSIDIVPAIDEDSKVKASLSMEAEYPNLINSSIAIPRYSQQKVYNWITNNPIGYKEWFDDINEKFNVWSSDEYRKKVLNESDGYFDSIEEIPQQLERSSLQRVIQILKYHRDIYYSHIQNGDNLKPISAIITTITTKISQNADPSLSSIDLLKYVITKMLRYEKVLTIGREKFIALYEQENELINKEGKWRVENPANPQDNLADSWNKNNELPKMFFKWLNMAKKELLDSLLLPDDEFRVLSENAFGQAVVEKYWGNKYICKAPSSISSSNQFKPWKK